MSAILVDYWQNFETTYAKDLKKITRQFRTEYADVSNAAYDLAAIGCTKQLDHLEHWILSAVRKRLKKERAQFLPAWQGDDGWHEVRSLEDPSVHLPSEPLEIDQIGNFACVAGVLFPGLLTDHAVEQDHLVDMAKVESALRRVPARYHPVARAALDGLSEREIAARVPCSRSTVHVHLTKIVQALQNGAGQGDLCGEDSSHGA